MSTPLTTDTFDRVPAPTEEIGERVIETGLYLDPTTPPQSSSEKQREDIAAILRLMPDLTAPAPPPSSVALQLEKVQESWIAEKETSAAPKQPGKQQQTQPTVPSRWHLRKWLTVATLLVAATTLTWHLTRYESNNQVVSNRDVIILDRTQLPNGSFLTEARRLRNTLIGVVAESWQGLDRKQQGEKMQALLGYAEAQGMATVILLNKDGKSIAHLSKQGVRIKDEASAEVPTRR